MRVQVTCRPELRDGEIVLHIDRCTGILYVVTSNDADLPQDVSALIASLAHDS